MTLYTNCILSWPVETDGHRISVMSRHTLNDGKTIDNRLTDRYDQWRPWFAPPDKLIGDYHKRGLPWREFMRRYLEHLRTPETAEHVKSFAKEASASDITIMCIEETPEKCHRKLLAEECKRYVPKLEVVIR